MELDLQCSAVEAILALLARLGVHVSPAQSQGAHMHLTLGAAFQRYVALLGDNDGILGVAAAEVDAHVVGSPGPARTARHRTQVLPHAVLLALLCGGLWHGFTVGDGSVGRGKGGEANSSDAMEAFSVGPERGAGEVCPAFGAVNSSSLAFPVSSHPLQSCDACRLHHSFVSRGGQANKSSVSFWRH